MKRHRQPLVALLFINLLALQAAESHYGPCLCEDGRIAAGMPGDALDCCSAGDALPGNQTMEEPDSGRCSACIEAPFSPNERRTRDLPSPRITAPSDAHTVALSLGAFPASAQHSLTVADLYVAGHALSVLRI